MNRLRLYALLVATAAVLPAARFGLEHAGRIVRLSDPQISPDGKSIVVVVSRSNFEENRQDAELVLVNAATRAQRVLTRGRRGVSHPRWSPDGSGLAFLAQAEGKPQIFLMPMAGGDARQLTKAAEGVQQFSWRPDGTALAFVAFDEPPKVTGQERHNKSFEAQHNHFLVTEAPKAAHLWLVTTDGAAPKRLTGGGWTMPVAMPPSSPSSPPSWSPDGRSIAVVRVNSLYSGDRENSTIQILDVETGALRPLTGRDGRESQPVFSPDGKMIAHWRPRDGEPRNVNEVHVGPAGGGETKSVTRGIDRNIMRSIWLPGGKSLLVSANDGTTVGLWVQPLEGPAKRLDLAGIVPVAPFWLDASVGTRGEIALTALAPSRPAELYLLASANASPDRLTSFNAEIEALELGRCDEIAWEGPDGFRMDGVVTFPPDHAASRKYPLVLYIHGGPRSSSKRAFSPRAQLLAAQGWIVFEPNYRGSDNLGNRFQAAIWNDAGAGPGRDVMSGVDELIRRGWVDESRMAVTGWSYGGFMTSWLLGNYPDRWKAGVAGAAVTDLLDQYNLSDSNVGRASAWGGSPYTDPARLRSVAGQSPISYATLIKAPTLILSNTGDYRVTVTQSYKLYHALRDNNVKTQMILYPLPGHSPVDPVHARDVDRRWIGWLKQYLD